MLFTLFLGINAFAAEGKAIVPTPKDYNGSNRDLLNTAMDWVNAHQDCEYTTENGAISVPIQVSKTGRVYIGVRFKERVTLESGLAVIMSTSADLSDRTKWMIGGSGSTVLFGDNNDDGVGAVAFNAEKAGTFYLHAFSAEVVDNPMTIQIAAFQTGIPVKAFSVSISKTSVTYNGKAQKPAVTVKNSNGKKISSSYTVKYSNNKNVGRATVTIIFKNAYSGTVKKTFTILPKGTTLSKVTA